MAHSSKSSTEVMSEYITLETLASGIGLLYVIFSAVTFDMMTQPTLMPDTQLSFTMTPEIAGWVALAALVIAFLASRTRDPSDYHIAEKVVVGVSFLSVPAVHYIDAVSNLLGQYPLIGGIAGVTASVVAFVIVVR